MTSEQWLILLILLATVAMFLWGRWRHDMVAAGSLAACVLTGLVPASVAFSGFSHPAVITVACVLVLSRGLQSSGAVAALTRAVMPARAGMLRSLSVLCALGAVLSGFMNNVGAMALLMPVAMQLAGRLELTPGQLLMPLAFSTILGGMTTMIGTPPNLIVSSFREQTGAGSFTMFDFLPVGLAVAAIGVLFITLLGWRWVPARKQSGVAGFESEAYITEAKVLDTSKAAGMSLREIEILIDAIDAQIIGMVINEVRMTAPSAWRRVRVGDILVIEAEATSLAGVLSTLGLTLVEAVEQAQRTADETDKNSQNAAPHSQSASEPNLDATVVNQDELTNAADHTVLMELAVLPGSPLLGRSARDIQLRTRYGMNLLAVSRHGKRSLARLRSRAFRYGDLLLMQGPPEAIAQFASDNLCVPLAERELAIPDKRKALEAAIIMALAVAAAAFGLVPAAIAFALGVLASMAVGTVPPRTVYNVIDWPVIVLLGALFPVAGALELTGTANLLAQWLLNHMAQGNAMVGLALILVVSMFLSDLMNNTATAAVMCPIAIATASALGVSSDPFLMAVAIGASCAFLTPIGHQNNTMILGPGGFGFGDYWKLGLPLELLVVGISLPMLLWVWPL
ncbi:SLC13 family permease [Shewanella sp. NIFS-20-20]|uniref:SLC13 family permease n=1 Tax=Shewanella sp. NIFS-20-20 TaxID=2853806 RepID=UPI001C4514A5|nr:SLC13 family permease [Shewanella sp. NIFS-20-20]MBV7314408.1 SLC13 family permease [Shewanella sp. NIFS-20-20]